MRLGVLTEPEGENRVAIIPNSVKKLVKKGLEVLVQSGAGNMSNYSDSEEFVTTYQRNGIGPSMNKAYIGLRCVTEPTDE